MNRADRYDAAPEDMDEVEVSFIPTQRHVTPSLFHSSFASDPSTNLKRFLWPSDLAEPHLDFPDASRSSPV